MDTRQVFDDIQVLKELLTECFISDTEVRLLIDTGGMERVNGYIAAIGSSSKRGPYIKLDSTTAPVILLKDIVAVNGLFRLDFSEC